MQRKTIKIVIVEDDRYFNKTLTKYVETLCNNRLYPGCYFEIQSFLNGHDCIENLEEDTDIMILDYFLFNPEEQDEVNGEDVLKEVKDCCPDCKVIVLSALQDSHTTAELMKKGIFDYIDKNVNTKNRLGAVLQKAIKA